MCISRNPFPPFQPISGLLHGLPWFLCGSVDQFLQALWPRQLSKDPENIRSAEMLRREKHRQRLPPTLQTLWARVHSPPQVDSEYAMLVTQIDAEQYGKISTVKHKSSKASLLTTSSARRSTDSAGGKPWSKRRESGGFSAERALVQQRKIDRLLRATMMAIKKETRIMKVDPMILTMEFLEHGVFRSH